MHIQRKKTRAITIGSINIGGGAPISVQSMTKTDTRDIAATVNQINELAHAGCQIVRVAVVNEAAARCLSDIKKQIRIPLIADIHFDYRLALMALEQGVDGLRINPGNIGGPERIKPIVKLAGRLKVPIRVGINAGSLEKDILARYGHPTPEALVESALRNLRLVEDLGFEDIKLSLKASEVTTTIEAYRLISQKTDYPLHVGVTEAGTRFSGAIKSAVGIGVLLAEGIGDTIRISLTSHPLDEVIAGYAILRSLGLYEGGVEMVSCPTCGRCQIDVIGLAQEIERRLAHIRTPLQVAVMGCAVNGPGEAKQADVGIAGGKGEALLFRRGEVVGKVKEGQLLETIVEEVEKLAQLIHEKHGQV
jgi:(E)-4-hydroxy-3-methylbut-2-enyl-diphosphate synthase